MALSRSARLQARTGAGHRAITSVPAPLQLTPGQLAPAALPSTTHASICQPAAHQIARSTDGSTPAARLWRTHRRAARCHAVLSEADSGPSAQVAAQTAIVYSAFTVSPGQTLQEMQAGLEQARLEDLPLSPAAIDALQATITPGALASLSHEQLASLLQSLAACTSEPLSTDCAASILNHTQDRIKSQLSEDDMRQLSSLLWAVSELGVQPSAEWLEVAAERLCTGAAAGSLFAQDLSTILCALGTMGYKTSSTTAPVIAKEIQVQVKEFMSDFTARDLARLISGIADMGLSSALPADFTPQLMKAIYTKVKSIEDKAAVDFALTKLDSEEKSIHYDTRWTYEELHWLPRRERDKRRIIAENWQKSQWGGYRPGRD